MDTVQDYEADIRLANCPACDAGKFNRLFQVQGYPVEQCTVCGLVFMNPQPGDEVLSRIYSEDYFLGNHPSDTICDASEIKRATAGLYLDQLALQGSPREGSLLDVGCGNGEMLAEAAARGYRVVGVEISSHAARLANESLGLSAVTCGRLEDAGLASGCFDICVCLDVIEHVRNPFGFLEHVHRVLKPNGVLLLVTPAIDSRLARLLGRHWHEFKIEHLCYFSRSTIQNILARAGFRSVELGPNRKVVTLEYIHNHFQRFRVPVISQALDFAHRFMPNGLRGHPITAWTGGLTIVARAEPKRTRPLVSVIMPVYNERRTVRQVVDRVIAKKLRGLDKELIIVESNSNDGTRDAVMEYEGLAGVQILLTGEARGKGHAVRHGLTRAKGDFVMIQDADEEYNIDDYDALLEPLHRYEQAFILGSRHKGHWQMRNLDGGAALMAFMNFGHIFFTSFFNLLYGQKLTDPWTMYKVFRRDCLHRMHLECDRFDFDVELIAKLVRGGFKPLEITVTYHSRSFAQGKKIRVLRDPWGWAWACVKYRFASIHKGRRSLVRPTAQSFRYSETELSHPGSDSEPL
jgi:glycosyltransferase involved in cell wall biosynthesis